MQAVKKALEILKRFIQVSWQFFTGVVIALIAFFGNFTDFKQPDVSVEITAVTSTSLDPIDVARLPELSALRTVMPSDGFIRTTARVPGYSVDDIDRQLVILTSANKTQSDELAKNEAQFNAALQVVPPDSKDSKVKDVLDSIQSSEVFPSFSSESMAANLKDKDQNGRIDEYIKEARSLLERLRKGNIDSSLQLQEAQKEWQAYKDNTLPKKARLIVTCAVGNRGSGATSLKPQALLRANLGEGNYLDLPMKLSGYESTPDLAALQSRSYKVVRFQSDEVQLMNVADQLRFKTFLGNVSPANIFVVDVRGNTYQSNSVPFSPGVYEQKVYDSLKQFATKRIER